MTTPPAAAVTRGLCAFPLTPLSPAGEVDASAFAHLVERAARAGVDSLGVLGSTGSYAYLDREQRARVARLAVEHAGGTPVVVGVGAVGLRQVLAHVEDAQRAGAAAVLLPVLQYQRLGDDEAFGLFEQVTAHLSVPLVVYDNPATTGFAFSEDLYARVAGLSKVAGIKVPPVGRDVDAARRRVQRLRELLPAGVSVGVSGDAGACAGLLGGADGWYSVVGGTLPGSAVALARAALAGDAAAAQRQDATLRPLWDLFAAHGGSLRVIAAVAEELGLVEAPCLPAPLHGLGQPARSEVRALLAALKTEG
jgi:4-hydroxy-tetrahydrodipicolinate synthase